MAEPNGDDVTPLRRDYTGNPQKDKQPARDKLEKKVVGEVVDVKEPIGRRMKRVFFGGDARLSWSYVAWEVLIPAARNMVHDGVMNFLDGMLFPEGGRRRRHSTPESRYSYNKPIQREYYRDPREQAYLPDQRPSDRWRQNRKRINDIIVGTRDEADDIVGDLIEQLEKYGVVSLVELNEILGRPTSPIDFKWGWRTLSRVDVHQVREGFLISFPPLEEI